MLSQMLLIHSFVVRSKLIFFIKFIAVILAEIQRKHDFHIFAIINVFVQEQVIFKLYSDF